MPTLLDDTELLRRLIALDSVSRHSNLPIAEFISDYLDRPGVRIHRNPSPDDTKTNLVIELGPEADPKTRAGLVLSGHMDVVPAEETEWTSDPFVMVERDDAYYGRGTADMKGFLALAMNRMALLEPGHLRRPLALLFTYDEELGTLGAHHFARTYANPASLPRQVVIGEPTSLRPIRMHKGHLKLQLVLRGVSAHSGYPHLGRNAIEPAARAIVALSGLRQELERERPVNAECFPEVPFVALNIAQVRGGVAVNVVPDSCTIDLGIRVLPGMQSPAVIERVRAAVSGAIGADFELLGLGDSPPFLLDASRPVHRHVCAAAHRTDSGSVSFATDAGWFQTIGFDCVIFGPGTIEVAHKPNESLPVGEFRAAAAMLDDLVRWGCIEEPPA